MANEHGRNVRVADMIQRELAQLMERDRLGSETSLITISNVDVSPDLKNAKIYVTCLGNEDLSFMDQLAENVGHYRHHLAKHTKLRGVPKLSFHYDHALERANRLTAIIDGLADSEAEDKSK